MSALRRWLGGLAADARALDAGVVHAAVKPAQHGHVSKRRKSASAGERHMAQAHRNVSGALKYLWRAHHEGVSGAMRIHDKLDEISESLENRA